MLAKITIGGDHRAVIPVSALQWQGDKQVTVWPRTRRPARSRRRSPDWLGDPSMSAAALLNGALLGGLYALVALGLSLVFGIMRVVNLAHGDPRARRRVPRHS